MKVPKLSNDIKKNIKKSSHKRKTFRRSKAFSKNTTLKISGGAPKKKSKTGRNPKPRGSPKTKSLAKSVAPSPALAKSVAPSPALAKAAERPLPSKREGKKNTLSARGEPTSSKKKNKKKKVVAKKVEPVHPAIENVKESGQLQDQEGLTGWKPDKSGSLVRCNPTQADCLLNEEEAEKKARKTRKKKMVSPVIKAPNEAKVAAASTSTAIVSAKDAAVDAATQAAETIKAT